MSAGALELLLWIFLRGSNGLLIWWNKALTESTDCCCCSLKVKNKASFLDIHYPDSLWVLCSTRNKLLCTLKTKIIIITLEAIRFPPTEALTVNKVQHIWAFFELAGSTNPKTPAGDNGCQSSGYGPVCPQTKEGSLQKMAPLVPPTPVRWW